MGRLWGGGPNRVVRRGPLRKFFCVKMDDFLLKVNGGVFLR